MMPKVLPKSSLKNGPTTPIGSVWRMSPMFLRTWYQTSGHRVGRRRLLQVDEDRRLPGRGVTAHAVEVIGFLQRAFEPLGDLLAAFLRPSHRARRHATIIVRNVNGRVFAAPQARERQARPRPRRRSSGRSTSERFGSAHSDRFGPITCVVSSRRTFWPGRSACTPAVTTTSPGFQARGDLHRGRRRTSRTSMLRDATVPVLRRPPTPPACHRRAPGPSAGISMPGTASSLTPAGDGGAEPHRRRRIVEPHAHAKGAGHRIGARRNFAHRAGWR